MKKTLFASAMVLALTACNTQPQASNAASGTSTNVAGLETESKQLSYFLGYEFAQNVPLEQLKNIKIELDKKAFFDAVKDVADGKENKISSEQATLLMQSIEQKMEDVAKQAASAALADGQKFLTDNKTKEGITELPSGLQIKTNKAGEGNLIQKGDLVSVEYEGRLTNGTVFDSTKEHNGQAFEVPVVDNTVIPGWIEGLQQMQQGGEYTLYIPASLAYGTQSPSPTIPANSVLVFDMKIVKVEKGEGAKRIKAMQEAQEKMMKQAQKAK